MCGCGFAGLGGGGGRKDEGEERKGEEGKRGGWGSVFGRGFGCCQWVKKKKGAIGVIAR